MNFDDNVIHTPLQNYTTIISNIIAIILHHNIIVSIMQMYFLGFEILEKWIARNGGGGQTLNWSAGASPYFCVQHKPHVPTMAWRSPLKAYVTS